jgi:hypothetical protein
MSICPSVCPSVRMYRRASHRTDFREIWYWGDFYLSRILEFVSKSDKKYRTHDTETESTLSCCRPYSPAIKALLCNAKYLYIVDSDGEINNKHRIYYCFSAATLVTRTRYNIVIHKLPVLCSLAQLGEVLRYKPEGRGFDSLWYHGNFSLI